MQATGKPATFLVAKSVGIFTQSSFLIQLGLNSAHSSFSSRPCEFIGILIIFKRPYEFVGILTAIFKHPVDS